MQILQLQPEDKAHKILMKLTQQGRRSILAILNMNRSSLEDLETTDIENSALTLDPWEVSEIINISRHAALQRAEKGEDFRLNDIDISSFEDFKLSPACTQVQYSQGEITRTPPENLS